MRIPEEEAQEIVEKLLETMKASLVAGEDVMVTGFGKWSVKQKRAAGEGIPRRANR